MNNAIHSMDGVQLSHGEDYIADNTSILLPGNSVARDGRGKSRGNGELDKEGRRKSFLYSDGILLNGYNRIQLLQTGFITF